TAASSPRSATGSRSAASAPPDRCDPRRARVVTAQPDPLAGDPPDDPSPAGRGKPAASDEVADLVGKLTAREDMDTAERRRLLGRLTLALRRRARRARAIGETRGKWLADVFVSIAPRIPIRDLSTLQEHHYG